MISRLSFKRTGKITLRSDCGEYLIIRYPTGYTALQGPKTMRLTLGHYADKEQAIAACNAHAIGEKKAPD